MQHYRLLKELAATTQTAFTTPDTPQLDMRAYKELLDAGYMEGDFVQDHVGRFEVFGGLAITLSGRDYLRQLEESLFHFARPGFFSQHKLAIYRWFFRILGTVIGGLVLWLITR